jgi:hypothetical protein
MYNRRGMDVSDLRQKILRALEAGRLEAATRRSQVDASRAAFDRFLHDVAAPLLRQTQAILKAENHLFTVHTPAGSARLAADAQADTYLEFVLETTGARPQVISRISVARGAKRVAVEEGPVAAGKPIEDLTESDVASFLIAAIPKLVR